jgi:hypothetical protein
VKIAALIEDLANYSAAVRKLEMSPENILNHSGKIGWFSSFIRKPKLLVSEYEAFLPHYEDFNMKREFYHYNPSEFSKSIFGMFQSANH